MRKFSREVLGDFSLRKNGENVFNTHLQILYTLSKYHHADKHYQYDTMHELVHVYAHYSTPYGLLLEAISVRLTILVRRLIRETSFTLSDLSVPLIQGAILESEFDESDAGTVLFRMLPWVKLSQFREILEGENVNLRTFSSADCFHLLQAIEDRLDDSEIITSDFREALEEFKPSLKDEDVDSCRNKSAVMWSREDEGEIAIGAAAVNEALAVLAPGGISKNSIYEIPDTTYSILWRMLQRTYRALSKRAQNGESERLVKFVENMARGTIPFHESERRIVCLISELALFTPIGFPFRHLRDNRAVFKDPETAWHHLAPGWRAVKAMQFIGAHLPNIDFVVANRRVIQDQICDYYGWPKIEEFVMHRKYTGAKDLSQQPPAPYGVARSRRIYELQFRSYYDAGGSWLNWLLCDPSLGDKPLDIAPPNLDVFGLHAYFGDELVTLGGDMPSKGIRLQGMLERFVHEQLLTKSPAETARLNPRLDKRLEPPFEVFDLAVDLLFMQRPELVRLFS